MAAYIFVDGNLWVDMRLYFYAKKSHCLTKISKVDSDLLVAGAIDKHQFQILGSTPNYCNC